MQSNTQSILLRLPAHTAGTQRTHNGFIHAMDDKEGLCYIASGASRRILQNWSLSSANNVIHHNFTNMQCKGATYRYARAHRLFLYNVFAYTSCAATSPIGTSGLRKEKSRP